MFRIPEFFKTTPSFKEAKTTMTNHGRGDWLEGMYAMDRVWEEHCASGNDDDDFYENWQYELNAYNTVYSKMKPLFV